LVSSKKSDALIDRLRLMGLTANQARAYLAVVRLGVCNVVQIARETELHRAGIYDVMQKLLSMGLIDETLDRPKRYRPTSIQQGIALLTEMTRSKLNTIAAEAMRLISDLEKLKAPVIVHVEPEARIVTGTENIRRNFRAMLASAQSQVLFMASKEAAARLSRSDIAYSLATIASKRLKARAILEVDESNVNQAKRVARSIEIRHYVPLHVHLYTIDDHTVGAGLTAANQTSDQLSELITSYPAHVKMLQQFYELVWRQAIPLNKHIARLEQRGSRLKRKMVA